MSKVIRPDNNDFLPSVFLAGPTYREDNLPENPVYWREQAIQLLEGCEIYSPEPFRSDGDYEKQIQWEHRHLTTLIVSCFGFHETSPIYQGSRLTWNLENGCIVEKLF